VEASLGSHRQDAKEAERPIIAGFVGASQTVTSRMFPGSTVAKRFGFALAFGAAGVLAGVASCDEEAESLGTAASLTEAGDEARTAPLAAGEKSCQVDALEACDAGWTGPSCDYACDPGAPGCGFRYYCHADGRVAGLALSRAHLFAMGPTLGPLAVRDRLEEWVGAHETDLGLADGLTAQMLQLEPADNFAVEQGLLTLYRFRQLYESSSTHLRVPVIGEGALLSLEADGAGAVALKGTVVDPRVPYAHARSQAPASRASASIKHHASVGTGIPEAEIEVGALQLVAAPWAEQIAWYGIPTSGFVSLGRVIVDADPAGSGWLGLLMFDDGEAYALHDTTPITVQTQDLAEDAWANPVLESSESTLANGAPLLGSIFDENSEAQLATEDVVVVDMHGHDFTNLYAGMIWDFERYTEASGQFTAGEPDEQFRAQRLYHLVKSGYALVDRGAAGKWDSGVQFKDPMLHSDYPPGGYRPRIVIGYNHASIGTAGQASWSFLDPNLLQPVLAGFPEYVQQPGPNLQHEATATINAPLGLITPHTLFHEAGHDYDVFLAPGYADDYAPPVCVGACDGCEEDTSDEANPLKETIAQMFAMWQLIRVFPNTPHDTCALMNHLTAGATSNQKNVHSPGCMDSADSIGLFIRDDDPACPDPTICDKPSRNETDSLMGAAHWCDATEGYNTFSILQAWWNLLHGLYCEPPGPMGVTCTPQQPVFWPPGCDQPGSGIVCATPDEVAGLAFLYAVRSNSTSYIGFFDDMAKFVSCNYGAEAYTAFNQALCDHHIRACDEPPPMSCQLCGNGIREGSEQCDGYDISADEIGHVPTCADYGYDDGMLACQEILEPQPCTYDFSLCMMTGLDETGATVSGTATIDEASDGLVDTDDATGPGVADGDEDGCTCTSSGRTGGRGPLVPICITLLFAMSRRGRPSEIARALGVAMLVSMGPVSCADCAPDDGVVAAEAGSSSTTEMQASSDSETSAIPIGWPEAWYGEYYLRPGFSLGVELRGPVTFMDGFRNMRIEAGKVMFERFTYMIGEDEDEWTFSTEIDGDALRVLPPDGEWNIPWFYYGADDVLIRAGADCDEIMLEAHGFPTPGAPLYSLPGSRGKLCLVDPYDDTVCCDKWMIDLCPGSVTDCDG
jgi:hypothetical protein